MVNQNKFLLYAGDGLTVAIRPKNAGAQKSNEKLVAVGEIFISTVERDLPLSRGRASIVTPKWREPRNNELRESFKITVGITFFDAFEERPKLLLR